MNIVNHSSRTQDINKGHCTNDPDGAHRAERAVDISEVPLIGKTISETKKEESEYCEELDGSYDKVYSALKQKDKVQGIKVKSPDSTDKQTDLKVVYDSRSLNLSDRQESYLDLAVDIDYESALDQKTIEELCQKFKGLSFKSNEEVTYPDVNTSLNLKATEGARYSLTSEAPKDTCCVYNIDVEIRSDSSQAGGNCYDHIIYSIAIVLIVLILLSVTVVFLELR